MAIDLDDAVTCVTGGGRGIGAATAAALVAKGARVVIGDIDLEPATEVATSLGERARAVRLDVTDPSSFASFLNEARRLGPVDLLVNNAGIQRTGAFADQDLDAHLREIAINLGGVIIGTRLALPEMLERRQGHIVNVSSMAGKMTVPGAAVYTASKFGVASLSRAIRSEIAGSGVTLTTVFPSAVTTELTEGLDTRGVPKSSPTDIAKTIVGSCRNPRAEITVPGWLGPIGVLEQVLPELIVETVKRGVGAQRRISPDNDRSRAYQERTARS